MSKEKIRLSRAVVVEGRYDKIKLSGLVDAVIIVTNGFGIYNDKELRRLIKFYAEKQGLIVLTDSDAAGRQIRGFIKNILPKELHDRVASVHIPQIKGKERRKTAPSKEGTLGVEGIPADTLRQLLAKFEAKDSRPSNDRPLTKNELYLYGLSGCPDSSVKREQLEEKLGIPKGLSPKALLDLLNTMYTREQLEDILGSL
ncbi:MAG: DUF4093 domain-containing protein [Ruminococcus sp.]|nr:DUF4093 domain-containing protein [Ruminococcus sp.]